MGNKKTGEGGGLGKKLMDEFRKKIFIFHCMVNSKITLSMLNYHTESCLIFSKAHKLELVFGEAMKKFDSFSNIEKEANSLYTFYSQSHKRTNFLKDFLNEEEVPRFSLKRIFDTRWVATHYSAMLKIYKVII